MNRRKPVSQVEQARRKAQTLFSVPFCSGACKWLGRHIGKEIQYQPHPDILSQTHPEIMFTQPVAQSRDTSLS